MQKTNVPKADYGVLQRETLETQVAYAAEEILRLGYSVIDSGFPPTVVEEIADEFNRVRADYIKRWGVDRLRAANELDTVRAMLTCGGRSFLEVALNPKLLEVISCVINGKFIINQQNGIVNPAGRTYNQGAWHRDLPYQHFVSSSPLAVNALFCIDEFRKENGATWVLPASHRSAAFPTARFIRENGVQVEARPGQYIVLDCMVFHSGGENSSVHDRRAVNQVYSIPYFKQQIKIPGNIEMSSLSAEERTLLGIGFEEPISVEEYLKNRERKVGIGSK